MNWKKGLIKASEEIGKHLFNIGVAVVVFSILQPVIKGSFNLKSALTFGLIYLIIFLFASILIIVGGSKDE